MSTAQTLATIPTVELPRAYWDDRGAYLAALYEQHGAIVCARLGQNQVVFLLGPEANRWVLLTQRHALSYEDGWGWAFGQSGPPRNLLTMDGDEHTWHRNLLHPAFASRHVDTNLPLIGRIVDRRLAGWAARGTVDLYEEARAIALDVVSEAVLGLRPGAETALARAVYLHGAFRRAPELEALLRRTITERRAQPTGDAVGLLAQSDDAHGCPIGVEQILAHADTLLIAGHETSATLAAWALYLLNQHPDYERRVLEELAPSQVDTYSTLADLRDLPVLDHALSEAERLYPPVPTAPRGVRRDVHFGEYLLPAGTLVLYSAAASHLLPSVWQSPTIFDPDRFAPPHEEHKRSPYALVGFGGGPRVCIGRTLARAELMLFLAHALSRYRLSVVPGQRIEQRYGVTSRPIRGIHVHVQSR